MQLLRRSAIVGLQGDGTRATIEFHCRGNKRSLSTMIDKNDLEEEWMPLAFPLWGILD